MTARVQVIQGISTVAAQLIAVLSLVGLGACARSAEAGVSHARADGTPPTETAPSPSTGIRAAVRDNANVTSESGPRTIEIDEIRREMQKSRGRTLFVHLWASWCGPCLAELPLIDAFAREARSRGAVVLSVSLDNDPRGIARVAAVLRARAPGLTNFVAKFDDPDQFMTLFSRGWEGAIPALFAFDRTGKLSASLIGEVEPSELDSLLPPLPQHAAPPARARQPR